MLLLLILSGLLIYAVWPSGGFITEHWNACMLGISLTATWHYARNLSGSGSRLTVKRSEWLLFAIPAYGVLQIIPLPAGLIEGLSEGRSETFRALRSSGEAVNVETLSVAPAATFAVAMNLAVFVLTYFLVRDVTRSMKTRPWVVAIPLVLIGFIEAAIGVTQFQMSGQSEIARGTYVNRNHFACLLEAALPFAIMHPMAAFHSNTFRWAPVRSTAAACAGLTAAACLLLGIVLSLSRGGFLAALSSIVIVGTTTACVIMSSRQRRRAFIAVALLVVAICFVLPPDRLVTRFVSFASGGDESAATRISVWQQAFNALAGYPFFGCGLGSFESAFLRYKTSEPMLRVDFVHNDYIQILVEAGLIGFAILAIPSLLLIKSVFRGPAAWIDPEARCLLIACAGSIAAILIHSSMDFQLYVPANTLVFAWVSGISMGVLASHRRIGEYELPGVPQFFEANPVATRQGRV